MKRINLTHGTARVDDDCPPETVEALNKISVMAYNMGDYWRKENPDYISLKFRIEDIEYKLQSGFITNPKTVRYKNAELMMLKNDLAKTEKYLE